MILHPLRFWHWPQTHIQPWSGAGSETTHSLGFRLHSMQGYRGSRTDPYTLPPEGDLRPTKGVRRVL